MLFDGILFVHFFVIIGVEGEGLLLKLVDLAIAVLEDRCFSVFYITLSLHTLENPLSIAFFSKI
jgi:hypothetical protein